MKGLCQNEVKARIERQKSERAVSRNHKHFWTGQKPFYQCNGGPFGRCDAWNPDKRNQPQCILLHVESVAGKRHHHLMQTWGLLSQLLGKWDLEICFLSVLKFKQHCDSLLPRSQFMSGLEELWNTMSPWDARRSMLEPWALTTHLAPRPGAVDHGTSPPLCTYSTAAGEVSAAGSIHPYSPHVKTPIRRDDKSYLFLVYEEESIVIVKIPRCWTFL